MGQIQILLAGISATGKSHFGHWLAETKGFLHVDMELPDGEPYSWGWHGLRAEWNAFCDGSHRNALMKVLKGRGTSVVLNWGFPPWMLPVVSALQAGGFSPWWFDGDGVAARKVFEKRAQRRLSAADSRLRRLARRAVGWPELRRQMALFDAQYERLSKSWPEIEPLFRGRVVTTLRPDGSFMEHEEIFSTIVKAHGEA